MALGGSLAGVARVVLRVDDSQFQRDLSRDRDQFRRTTHDMSNDSEKMARGVLAGSGAFHTLGRSIAFASGSFLGAAGFTAVVRQSIGAASDLNEQMNKVRVVFKDGAQEVIEFSKTTTNALGISQQEALATAGTFGNMLVPMGFARKEAAGMSVNLVKLAADMASFNNADPAEVLEALRSGLAGEVEPLRRFGVQVSDARERQVLMEAGVKNLGGTLTAQQKTWAAYQLILKDTADAQGDFSRTSGGLANQQRLLHAQLQQTEAQIGQALLPTVLDITKGMTKWLGSSENQARVQRDVNEAVGAAKEVFGDLKTVVEDVDKVTGGFKQTLELLLALKVISVLGGWSGAFTRLIGAEAAAGAAGGTGVAGAAASAGLLRSRMAALSRLGVITIGIEFLIHRKDIAKGFGGVVAAITGSGTVGDIAAALQRAGVDVANPATGAKDIVDFFTGRGGGKGGGSTGGLVSPPTVGGGGGAITPSRLKRATAPFANIPYQWGGGHSATPGPSVASGHGRSGLGLDCSGYARAVLANLGISVSGTADQLLQSAKSHPPLFGLQPGDLIFYEGIHPQHVMVYIGGGRVIGETHTGASGPEVKDASYMKITGTGRYVASGKGQAVGDASGGDPPTTHTPPKPKSQTAMPDALRLRLADAHGDAKAQVAILTEFEGVLEQRKRAAKKVSDKADIQEEIDNVLDKIGTLRKKSTKKAKTVDVAAMPDQLRLEFETAVGKKDSEAQIRILNEFIGVLERRKRLAKTVAARADITAEINTIRTQVTGIRGDVTAGRDARAKAALDKTVTGIGSISDVLTSAIGNLTAGGTGVQDTTDASGKVISKQFAGQSVVRFDPKSKTWIVTKVKPDLDALRTELKYIQSKVLPTLDKRIAATQRAIQRLSAHPKKNKQQLAHQRTILAALKQERGEVTALATDLAQSIDEMGASLELEPDKEDAGPGATDLPADLRLRQAQEGDSIGVLQGERDFLTGQLAGATSMEDRISITGALRGVNEQISSYEQGQSSDAEAARQAAADAARQALADRADYLLGVPADVRLAQAQAGLTADTGDDQSVLLRLQALTQQQLAAAVQDGNSQIETQISLTERLSSINSQLNSLRQAEVAIQQQQAEQQAKENEALIQYLQMRRDLSRTYDDTVVGRRLAGTTIIVQNTFPTVPPDPHIFSQNLGYELRALSV